MPAIDRQLNMFVDGQPEGSPAGAPIDTRREARRAVAARLDRLQRDVLAFIAGRGPVGATDDEICRGLHLLRDTGRARRVELRGKGLILDSGRSRVTSRGRAAIVWTAVDGLRDVTSQDAADGSAEGYPQPGTRPTEPASPIAGLASPAVVVARIRAGACPWCGGQQWWRSVRDVLVCEVCHPPAVEALVAERAARSR